MRRNTFILLFIIIIGLMVYLFFSEIVKESYIKYEIKKANYCQLDSDCVDAGSKCPFGCYVYVNEGEAKRISDLINSFDSKCVYGCLSCPTAKCENDKCVEVCE